jgi:hypothetical protein
MMEPTPLDEPELALPLASMRFEMQSPSAHISVRLQTARMAEDTIGTAFTVIFASCSLAQHRDTFARFQTTCQRVPHRFELRGPLREGQG